MKRYYVLLYTLLTTGLAFAQPNEQIIARVGNINVTASEFTERFELTPWPKGNNQQASQNPQLDFLYTLIAEKLLAQEAENKGYDSSKAFLNAFKTIEKMYVRDALYKHEILDKINISTAEIEQAFEKERYQLKLDYIKSDTEKEIQGIYKSLKHGTSFQSILRSRGGFKDSCITVSFGELSEPLENILYKLKPGQNTAPVSASDKWYIFRLVEKVDQLAKDPKNRDQILSLSRKAVHQRKNDKNYQEFHKKFFSGKKVETDGSLFWSFSDKVIAILKKKKTDPNIVEKEKTHLTIDDFFKIENEFGPDTLSSIFIRFNNDPISLKQFINEIAYDGFVSAGTDERVIRIMLENRVKTYIENELLAREGYQEGLQNLPDVKKSIKMWKENYLAQVVKSKLMDSVKVTNHGAESLASNSEKVSSPQTLVNIVEVLTDSLETVEKVLNELKSNKDIKEVARIYSKRESTRKSSGEFGYFPVTENGEIGRIAAKMAVGEIYGPLKTNEGYSIFKLIGKKEDTVNAGKITTSNNEKAINDLKTQKYLNVLTEHTARLAKISGVKINNDLLDQVQALNLNLFAYRNMGFGGKIMAVPLIAPFTDWIKSWQKPDSALP